jgi:hypothetical protein
MDAITWLVGDPSLMVTLGRLLLVTSGVVILAFVLWLLVNVFIVEPLERHALAHRQERERELAEYDAQYREERVDLDQIWRNR